MIDIKLVSVSNLCEAKEILESLDVDFCLFLGTALGAYRDHDFCPGDVDDIDLAVKYKDYKKIDDIKSAFMKSGFKIYNCWEAKDKIAPEISFYRMVDGVRLKVDLFFITESDDSMLWRFYENMEATKYNTRAIDKTFFDEYEKIDFYGHEFNVPSPIEKYLEANYGKDWRTPIHRDNWNWLSDNRCKTLQS